MFCRKCGNNISDSSTFCGKCGEKVSLNGGESSFSYSQPNNDIGYPQNNGKEDIVKGIVGALLGSLIGAVAIILIGQLGYVASVSGFVMAIATIALYEKFAKGISKTGIVICIIVMLVMTFLSVNMSLAVSIASILKKEGLDANIFAIFSNIFELIDADYIDMGDYIANMLFVYLFTIIGAVGTIKSKLSELKTSRR